MAKLQGHYSITHTIRSGKEPACLYPVTFHHTATIQWPGQIEFKGRIWFFNSITATSAADHVPCAQYANRQGNVDSLIWLHCDGSIDEIAAPVARTELQPV